MFIIDFFFSINKLFHLSSKVNFFIVVTKISFKDHDYEYHLDTLRVSLMQGLMPALHFCFRGLYDSQCYNI